MFRLEFVLGDVFDPVLAEARGRGVAPDGFVWKESKGMTLAAGFSQNSDP